MEPNVTISVQLVIGVMCHIIIIYTGKLLCMYVDIVWSGPVIITRAQQYLIPQCKIILWYSDLVIFGKGVRLRPLSTSATISPIVASPECGEIGGVIGKGNCHSFH
jgi:hypothetical protein